MNFVISPGARTGAVRIPASKSQAHRLLICAALGKAPVTVRCDGLNADILATAASLRALGANIAEQDGALHVEPIKAVPDGLCVLPCGESGSTLRFLLPVVGALGADAVFLREGRLPERPLESLLSELVRGGMMFRSEGGKLFCSGKLAPGEYTLPGNISSQYISALLFALPRLAGDSALTITGARESEGYIAMTENALAQSGVRLFKTDSGYDIPGGQTYALPAAVKVEGDYSSAAFFLCMGALSRCGITVSGLRADSAQGDRAVLDILRAMGACAEEAAAGITVRRGTLHGAVIDAAPVPDLIPALCALAAAAEGETTEDGAASTTLTATAMLRLSGWRPYQLQCVADAFSTRFETTLTPQTLATESLLCALDETTVLRGSGPLPDAGAHILACFASFGPVSLTRQEGRAVLTARAVVSAFAENTLGEMECYEKALDYALPLPADLPPDTDAYPECWLSVQDLQCASAGGALDVSLTVRAEGAVLARQTASLVGAVELGDPLAPADPEVSLRICYAQPGEELFAIARRYHVSPGQMLAANDLPDGTARLDEARRLLVPGV